MTNQTNIRIRRSLHRTAALALAAALPAAPSLAEQPSLIRAVADGKPWTMTQSNGQTGQMTLGPNGKGTMQLGSRKIAPTWRVAEQGQLCLRPASAAPERCVSLSREGVAIVGINNGAEHFRLTRP